MNALKAGCHVGFSDDIQSGIPKSCVKCGAKDAKWFPWCGLWLCKHCYICTDSETLNRLKEKSDGKS